MRTEYKVVQMRKPGKIDSRNESGIIFDKTYAKRVAEETEGILLTRMISPWTVVK
ncbi:hypothetical protein [Microlunatus soli]|uniref:Uncharacterized protein n=1 Tax=Microlunatus soli TaxID=630515 RepID=A0A1H1N963_9ACTN|nr:hypothetical protein [Microlunatus soli]SDR95532.1 hypothetical protein SAMN04489812_0432 [Microlunatus soli]